MTRHQLKPANLVNLTTRELNDALLDDYGHGIFPFALSAAIHILKFPSFGRFELWEKKNVIPEYWLTLRNEIINIEGIKEELLKVVEKLDDHLEKINYWGYINNLPNYLRDLIGFPGICFNPQQVTRPLNRDLIVRNIYRLSNVVDSIDEELEFYKNFKAVSRKRGRPVESKLVIGSLWSLIIKRREKSQWARVHELFDWFKHKLRETEYLAEIQAMPQLEDLRRFRKKYATLLATEASQIFRHYDNVNNPMGIQINFKRDSPQLWAIGLETNRQTHPTICFPDGTTFP